MPKTLADMTAEERFDCVGMWCDVKGFTRPTPIVQVFGEEVELLVYNNLRGHITETYEFSEVTPRFDLPSWATPEGEPVEMVKEYGIFYTLRDGGEEICFVNDDPLSVEPAVKHLEKSLRRGTITSITRKTQWVTKWEEMPEPRHVNGMENPYV